jgi:hypothetical protein
MNEDRTGESKQRKTGAQLSLTHTLSRNEYSFLASGSIKIPAETRRRERVNSHHNIKIIIYTCKIFTSATIKIS